MRKYVTDFSRSLSMTPSLLKSQAYRVTVPVDWSVKWTVSGDVPDVASAANAATGLPEAAWTPI